MPNNNNRQFPGIHKTPEIFEFSLHNVNEATNIDITQFTVIGSVLVKSSNLIKHGKRLENMSWRIMGKNLVSDKSGKSASPAAKDNNESNNAVKVDEKFRAKKGLVPQYVFEKSVNAANTTTNNSSISQSQSTTKSNSKKHNTLNNANNADNFLTFSDFNSIASIVAQPSLIETLAFMKRTNSSSSISAMNHATNLHKTSSSSSLHNLNSSSVNNSSITYGTAGVPTANTSSNNGGPHGSGQPTTASVSVMHSYNNESTHPHATSTSLKSRNALMGSRPSLKKNSSKGKLALSKNAHSLSTGAISSLLMKKSGGGNNNSSATLSSTGIAGGSGAGTTSTGASKLVSNASLQNMNSYNISNHSIFNNNPTNKLLPGHSSKKTTTIKTTTMKGSSNNSSNHTQQIKTVHSEDKLKSINKHKNAIYSSLFDGDRSKKTTPKPEINMKSKILTNNIMSTDNSSTQKLILKPITNSNLKQINVKPEPSHLHSERFQENKSSDSIVGGEFDENESSKKVKSNDTDSSNSQYDQLSNSDDSDIYSSDEGDDFNNHHPPIKKFISNDSFSEKLAQLKNEVGISEEQLTAARNKTLNINYGNGRSNSNKMKITNNIITSTITSTKSNKKEDPSKSQHAVIANIDKNNNDKDVKPSINTSGDDSNIRLLKRQSSLFANQKAKKAPSILLSDDSFSEEEDDDDEEENDDDDDDEDDDYDDDSSGNSSGAYSRQYNSLNRFKQKKSVEDKQLNSSQKSFNTVATNLINNSNHAGVNASTSLLNRQKKQHPSKVDRNMTTTTTTTITTGNNVMDSDNDEWTDEDDERSSYISGVSRRKSSRGNSHGEVTSVKRSLLSGLFLNELQKGYSDDILAHSNANISQQSIVSPPKIVAGLGGRFDLKNKNTSKSSLVSKNSNTNKSIGSDQSKVVFSENGGLKLCMDNISPEMNPNKNIKENITEDNHLAPNNKSMLNRSGSSAESVGSMRSDLRTQQLPPVESMVTVNVEANTNNRKLNKQVEHDRPSDVVTSEENNGEITISDIRKSVRKNSDEIGIVDDDDATSTKSKVTITGSMKNSDFENNHKLLRSYSSSSTVTGDTGNISRRGSTTSAKSSFTNLLQLGFSVFGGGNASSVANTITPANNSDITNSNSEKNPSINNSGHITDNKRTSNAPDTAKSLLHTVYASHVFHQQKPPGVVSRGGAGINRGYGNTKPLTSINSQVNNNNINNSHFHNGNGGNNNIVVDGNFNYRLSNKSSKSNSNGAGVKDVDIRNIVFGSQKNQRRQALHYNQHSEDDENDNFDFDNYHNRGW